MRFLSLFSGIDAASVAWKPLGWECVGFSEIDDFPCEVLKYHYPNIPNLGDISKITKDDIIKLGQIDLIVFGSPCQDLSTAGKKLGFEGERSGLFNTAIKIIEWAKKYNGCRFALWENVTGAFSSNKGRDFAIVVEKMAGCRGIEPPKYGWGNEGISLGDKGMLEWAVLDAQWFGVPQRRRRIYAISDFGNWYDRPPILLEPDRLRKTFSESHPETKNTTPIISTSIDEKNKITYGIPGNWIGRSPKNGGNATTPMLNIAPCLTVTDRHAVMTDTLDIRRFTPSECEALQGFPKGYTDVPFKYDIKEYRYKALGNSMAVPVINYIGKQIQKIL